MSDNYYDNLPKKRMGAGALFFNSANQLLLVKPSYKDHWGIPGGVVDSNESPRASCIREIKEELGLNINKLQFLSVGYFANPNNGKRESLQFLFYGGVLTPEDVAKIKLTESEISDYKFVSPDVATTMVSPDMAKRLSPALESIQTGIPVYLEKLD